jgi:polysaccharide biosynthesis protein PslG
VRHFKGRVDQFEVWNEWNIGLGSPTRRPGTAQAYVPVLRAAYQAVKAENPSAVVIGGAVAGIDDRWIEAFGEAGGFQYLDAFSVHPYNYQQERPTPEADIEHLDALKARVDHFAPGRDLQIYVTEVGWPTHEGPHGSTEATEAANLQRFLLLAKSRSWIAGVWWYDLFDDGDNPHDKENRFGLLSHAGVGKPAFEALLAIRPFLESANALAVTSGKDGHITVKGKGNDGKRLTASWLPTEDSRRAATPLISVGQ